MPDAIENPIGHWLPEFLLIHRANFLPADWPPQGTEEWQCYVESWADTFERENVLREEAISASRMLTTTPPSFRRQHIEMVMQEIRRERVRKAVEHSPGSREAAEAHPDTINCPNCGKTGLVVVYHRLRGTPGAGEYTVRGEVKRGPETTAAHCDCPLGRWIRQNVDSQTLASIPNYSDVRLGLSKDWHWKDPGAAQFVKEHGMIHDIEQLRAFMSRVDPRSGSKGPVSVGDVLSSNEFGGPRK